MYHFFQVVTSSSPDLFWALRGGGGSTFGVTIQFKFKLHVPPPGGLVQMVCLFASHYGSYPLMKDVLAW